MLLLDERKKEEKESQDYLRMIAEFDAEKIEEIKYQVLQKKLIEKKW